MMIARRVSSLAIIWALIFTSKFLPAISFTPGLRSSLPVVATTTTNTIITLTGFQNNQFFPSDIIPFNAKATKLHIFKTKQQQQLTEVVTPVERSFLTEPAFLAVWVLLVLYAFGPGEFNRSGDEVLLEAVIANMIQPEGMNELASLLFNLFTPLPYLMAGLAVPITRSLEESASGISKIVRSSVPYVIGSTFLGFFVIGPFLAIRPKPYEGVPPVPIEDRSWITRNILENKLFAYVIIAVTVYLPFGTNFVEAYQNDPNGVVSGYIDLMQTSRFVPVSNVDLLLCHLALTLYLLPIDYKARNPNASNNEVYSIAAVATLIPFLGTAIYMAVRPPLPSRGDNDQQ